MTNRPKVLVIAASAVLALSLSRSAQGGTADRAQRCRQASPRSAAMIAWLTDAFSSPDSSWVRWRTNLVFAPLSSEDLQLVQTDSLCARGATALHQATQYVGDEPEAVYLVRLGSQGFAVTVDSLYSNGSLMLLTDTTFAPRTFQQWRDSSAHW